MTGQVCTQNCKFILGHFKGAGAITGKEAITFIVSGKYKGTKATAGGKHAGNRLHCLREVSRMVDIQTNCKFLLEHSKDINAMTRGHSGNRLHCFRVSCLVFTKQIKFLLEHFNFKDTKAMTRGAWKQSPSLPP